MIFTNVTIKRMVNSVETILAQNVAVAIDGEIQTSNTFPGVQGGDIPYNRYEILPTAGPMPVALRQGDLLVDTVTTDPITGQPTEYRVIYAQDDDALGTEVLAEKF